MHSGNVPDWQRAATTACGLNAAAAAHAAAAAALLQRCSCTSIIWFSGCDGDAAAACIMRLKSSTRCAAAKNERGFQLPREERIKQNIRRHPDLSPYCSSDPRSAALRQQRTRLKNVRRAASARPDGCRQIATRCDWDPMWRRVKS